MGTAIHNLIENYEPDENGNTASTQKLVADYATAIGNTLNVTAGVLEFFPGTEVAGQVIALVGAGVTIVGEGANYATNVADGNDYVINTINKTENLINSAANSP